MRSPGMLHFKALARLQSAQARAVWQAPCPAGLLGGSTVRSYAWGVTAGPDHPPAGPPQGPEMVVNEHPPVAIAPQKTAAKM